MFAKLWLQCFFHVYSIFSCIQYLLMYTVLFPVYSIFSCLQCFFLFTVFFPVYSIFSCLQYFLMFTVLFTATVLLSFESERSKRGPSYPYYNLLVCLILSRDIIKHLDSLCHPITAPSGA